MHSCRFLLEHRLHVYGIPGMRLLGCMVFNFTGKRQTVFQGGRLASASSWHSLVLALVCTFPKVVMWTSLRAYLPFVSPIWGGICSLFDVAAGSFHTLLSPWHPSLSFSFPNANVLLTRWTPGVVGRDSELVDQRSASCLTFSCLPEV